MLFAVPPAFKLVYQGSELLGEKIKQLPFSRCQSPSKQPKWQGSKTHPLARISGIFQNENKEGEKYLLLSLLQLKMLLKYTQWAELISYCYLFVKAHIAWYLFFPTSLFVRIKDKMLPFKQVIPRAQTPFESLGRYFHSQVGLICI